MAKNVQVSFTLAIPDPSFEKAAHSVIPYLKKRYAQPIAALAPGAELRNVYYVHKRKGGDEFANEEDVPDRITVTITYQSADGKQNYKDPYDLDVAVLNGETRVSSSRSLDRQVAEIRKSVQSIDKTLGQAAKSKSPIPGPVQSRGGR